ncbi:MAG: gliding motility-associated C-terminal domain-containing protein [Bacteroidia bacterium]|nr:gliding motility-associated C-terminal domain-containing protein [Bacteroidia bacterium]
MAFLSNNFRAFLLFFFALLSVNTAWGEHLVGGDLTYKCLGKNAAGLNEYEITLYVYRDCIPSLQFPISNTPFDQNVIIYIRDGRTFNPVRQLNIPFRDSVILQLTTSDTCVSPPTGLCYALATFRNTVALPDNPNGYFLAWARCCRNRTIQNIIQPESSGMILPAFIPNTALCNNSPEFVETLPTYICVNALFQFDHSAIDPDGDSLVYALTVPFTAGDRANPFPVPSAPPYQAVNWLPPYNINNVMNANPNLTVNSRTGLMQVRPRQTGQYVFSLSVYEYRNGVLLSEVKRDIQINVIDCPINLPPEVERPTSSQINGDTLIFYRGVESCFDFKILDLNGPGVKEDKVSVQVEGDIFDPVYGARFTAEQGLAPLDATICWAPSCEVDNIPNDRIIIQATDDDDCPGPNITRDTLYIKILPGTVFPPDMECVSVVGDNAIQLTWNGLDPGDRLGFQHYQIFRQEGNEWVPLTTVSDAAQHTYTDSTASNTNSRQYCYRVQTIKMCPDLLVSEPGLELCSTSGDDIQLCRVTVMRDSGVEVLWNPLNIPSFYSFRIYRKGDNEQDYELADEIFDPSASRWLDTLNTAADGSWCYRLALVDLCGAELFSRAHCTIFLNIRENNDELLLNWTDYRGWPGGIDYYELFSIPETGTDELLANLPAITRNYTDASVTLEEGKYCYQVKAIEAIPGCGFESWSNVACYVFVPRVYIPNAFTPNNDGHNDIFLIRGGFIRDFQLSVYNRWGTELFTTLSIENGWDGTYKGGPVQEGVYVYRFSGTDFDGNRIERSGSITLLR